jgi:aspartyl-tRNA(Asn)/glutamyl-tRNA(Gln) amidotransferase subunit C
MALTDQEIRSLAYLARLELSELELQTIGPQLEQILGFVAQLSELDTDHVEPMTTALDVMNRWADDIPAPSLPHEDALKTAPAHDGDYFLVPPVLGSGAS